MERSSETIYRKYYDGTQWSDEEYCNKGIYTYEYDTQGRIISKTVMYENKNDYTFESYYISVVYDNPEYTLYRKSVIDSNHNYNEVAEWSFYQNGQMRHYDDINFTYQTGHAITFDENGSCIAFSKGDEQSKELHGTLNDSTITHFESHAPVSIESYVYNPDNGKLTEYKEWGYNLDSHKYEYIYDEYGRISAIRKYYDQDDDDKTARIGKGNKASSTHEHELIEEPQWRLEYNETFSYFNDEVYGIGNPWHDVFGFDGPLINRHLVDDDYEPNNPWVEDLTLHRDANGKLLSVVSTKPEDNGDVVEKNTIDVDDNGHITREYSYFKENGWEEITTVDYLWENNLLTSAKQTDEEKSSYGSSTSVVNYTFTYGNGSFSYQRKDNNGEIITGNISQRNKGYRLIEGDTYFIQEVQTEDVRFVRPNLVIDYAGFSSDSTIIASVKDRVVAFGKSSWGGNTDYQWGDIEWLHGDIDTYFTTNEGTYFSISHEGDLTICSNYEGKPVFVLKDGKLLKEIIYYETYSNVETKDGGTRVAIPTGQAYKEITYVYDDKGLVVGQTVTTVDEDGTKKDEVVVEVKYDPTSGINNMTVTTQGTLSLSGRTIGLANGQTFSVYTIDGVSLTNNASSFTFPKAGIYMITVNGTSIKLNIK